jgi:hypothetical protein
MKRYLSPLAALLVGASLIACGDSGGDTNTNEPTIDGYSCTRDATLMARHTECAVDVHCPCGTFCDKGLCDYACLQDTDCPDGQWCDYFGHCRTDEVRASLPPLTEGNAAQLTLWPQYINVYETAALRTITLRAAHGDIIDVRLLASSGLEVDCGEGFVRECRIATVSTQESQTVQVRVNEGVGVQRDSWLLHAYYGARKTSVALGFTNKSAYTEVTPGVYEGQLVVNRASATLETDQALAPETLSVQSDHTALPVTLTIYEDRTLVIEDLLGVLPAQWVFALRYDGTFDGMFNGTDLSRRIAAGDAQGAGDHGGVELTIAGTGTVSSVDTTLSGKLLTQMGGFGLSYAPALATDERLHLEWNYTVRRIGDVPAGATPPPLGTGVNPKFSPTADRYTDALDWTAEIGACGALGNVGTTPTEQIQGYLCYNYPSGTFQSEPFVPNPTTTDLTASGDVKCVDAANRPTAFPLFTEAERTPALQARQLLTYCLAELPRAHMRAVTPTHPTGSACLNEISGCSSGICTTDEPRCINGPVALHAIGLGMDGIERSGFPDATTWSVTDDTAVKISLRLIQQWIQVHTFTAREAAQQADQYLGTVDVVGQTDALQIAVDGWKMLLHPRIAGRLMHLPATYLAHPDYRSGVTTPAMSQDHTQAVGLPVVIMEGLRAHTEAASQLVNRVRYTQAPVPEVVPQTMLYGLAMRSLAALLYERAAASGALDWQTLWDESLVAYRTATDKLGRELQAHRLGHNPLGVDDQDLPLYRGLTTTGDAGLRFAAISTFILDHFVTGAVNDAVAAKADADAAWDLLLSRQLQAEMDSAQKAEKSTEVQRIYGEKILNLCGNPYELTSDQVLEPGAWPGLSPVNCFMNQANSQCVFDESAFTDRLTQDDVGYQLCVLVGLKERLGDKARLKSEDVNAMVDQAEADIWNSTADTALGFFPQTPEEWYDKLNAGLIESIVDYAECEQNDGACGLTDLMTLDSPTVGAPQDEAAFLAARDHCKAIFGASETLEQKISADPALTSPDCYQGSVGALVLAARSAAKDVDTANSRLQEYTDTYQAALWSCSIDDRALEISEDVSDQIQAIEDKITRYTNTSKAIVDVGSNILGIAFGVVGAIAGADLGAGVEVLGDVSNSVYGSVQGEILSAQDSALGIDKMKDAHQTFLADFADHIEDMKCYHDAEMHLIGAYTQAHVVEKAKLDLAASILKIRNAQSEVKRLIKEGTNRASSIELRSRTSLMHDIWKDLWDATVASSKGKVEDYRKKMRLAQRMVYLALRAVEYELQLSPAESQVLREQVLGATTPSDLSDLMLVLDVTISAGNISGQPAANRHVELSLRDHLLQLADRSDLKQGLHTMTPTERFQKLLASPRYASYDEETGAYRGQVIPFSLAPMGVIGLGQPGTISLLTGTECAERNWGLSVAVQGEDLVDDQSTYSQVGVLQKNDFFSQWCTAPAGGDENTLQRASVRPVRNLFKDPQWGGNYGSASPSDSEYVIALVDAYFNVDWADFQAPEYVGGGNETFACRALYGDYALFFSADKISIHGSAGLHLEHITDVWIRFDYVSAAKQW